MKGRLIGQYRITGVLGEGGMGMVYSAQHTLLDRPAAIKVLLPKLSGEQEIVQRFFNEARAATVIRNPGIVEIYDFGWTEDGAAFIVMELLQGETLRARRKRGPLRWSTALALARQVAGALAAAHAKGIVHRDLKPDNIFLVPDAEVPGGERIKLLDFGIAKLAGPSTGRHKTRTGMVMGTPAYMAPEQCRGIAVDARADLYALGCILFELCTGQLPFESEGEGDMLLAHIQTPPPVIATLASGIPEEVESLVQRLLAKAPADRVQTADELIRFIDMARTAISQRGMSGQHPVLPRPGSVDDREDDRDMPESVERSTPESAARTEPAEAGGTPTMAERSAGRRPRRDDVGSAPVTVAEDAPMSSTITAPAKVELPSSSPLRTTLSSVAGTISLEDPPVISRWWKISVGGGLGILAALGTLALMLGTVLRSEVQTVPQVDLAALNSPTANAAASFAATRSPTEQVTIIIQSEPSGALVSSGPTFFGTTPLDVTIERGDHDRIFKLRLDGYQAGQLVVRPTESMQRTVKLRRSPSSRSSRSSSQSPSSPRPTSPAAGSRSPAPQPTSPAAPSPPPPQPTSPPAPSPQPPQPTSPPASSPQPPQPTSPPASSPPPS